MNKHRLHVIAASAALSMAVLAQAASDLVLIDHGEPAYTVYAGLPAQRADDVRAKIARQPAELVSFKEFSEERARFVGERIVIDEYAGSRAIEGVVELIRKIPGTPFGITWNGGIAFTRNDYQYAKRQFAVYSKDPEAYRRTRNTDQAADPLNPATILRQLLGW